MSTPREIAKIRKMMNLETNTLKPAYYDSDSLVSTANTGVQTPVGTISVSSADTLPLSNIPIGQQGFVTTTNKLYIYNGSGWYNIAAINNAPYWDTEANATYALAVNGTSTVVTLAAGDSDGTTLSYTATGDSNFNAIATVTKDSDNGRIFTITPIDSESSASPTDGSGVLTFRASDGIDQASTASTFSITFGPNWSTITESKITASNAGAGDQFGYSVGINGDGTYAIIGSKYEDFAATNTGAAYIFTRSGSSWTEQALLRASDAANSDEFGNAVDINGDGDKVIIGSWGDDDGGSQAGSAYIFTRSGSTWTQAQKLVALDDTANDRFGSTVAISKDGMYAVIGAYQKDNGGTSQAGAAYIFSHNGSSFTQQAKLLASDAQATDQFGWSVGISSDGTYAIIGAQYEDTGASGAGAAYIFKRINTSWSQQAKIQASDAQANDYFGYSVDINSDGTTAIVGAFYEDGGAGDPYNGAGAAYIFTRSGSTWTQQQQLHSTTPNTSNISQFGHSVSINDDGNLAAIGATYENAANNTDFGAGRVHVFEKSGSTWSSTKVIIASDAQANDYLGEGTGGAKGVGISNDGKYIIAGAKQEDGGAGDPLTGQGSAYIWEAS